MSLNLPQTTSQIGQTFSLKNIESLNTNKKTIWKESNKPLRSISPTTEDKSSIIQLQLIPKGLPKVVTASIRQVYEERKQSIRLSADYATGVVKAKPLLIVKSIQKGKY